MIRIIKKILLPSIISALLIGSFNSSLYDKKTLAQNYYESELYDDAIIIYEEIFLIEKEVFGYNSLNRLETVEKLYKIHLLNKNADKAKEYIQEYLDIQYSYIVKQQNSFIQPLEELKNIYTIEKKPDIVFEIDSLIQIINDNTDIVKKDSALTLPKIIININDTTNIETEYTNNDIALEYMGQGLNYLKNNLYTDAKINFSKALDLNAEILNLNYFKKINFGQEGDELYNSFVNDINEDSTKQNYNFYLGLMDYQKKEYENAIKYLIDYNKYNQSDITTLLLLGEINEINTNFLDAMFYYYRVLKNEPNNFNANNNLARILIELGDYNESINILKYLLKNNNKHEVAYNLGYSYYRINSYEESIKYFTQAILINPEDYQTYYYLGLSYKNKKLYKQSLDAFKKCISLNSSLGLAHYELGLLYEMILNDDLAIQHFELAKKNETFDDLNYRLGMLYYKNQNFLKAMNPLKEYLLKHMEDYETMKIVGEIFIQTNRYSEAIDIYYRLSDHEPNNKIYYNNIADSYYKLKDFDNALIYYLKVVELDEESYNVFIDIGTILNKKNLFAQSEAYLSKALDCGYPNKNLLMQLGISYGGQKKFLQSLITFKETLKFSLEDPILHYQIGIIYKELQIFDLAIENLSFYLNTNKKDEMTLSLIGSCYLELNEYEQAIQYFEKIYKLNNNNYNALFNIGKCYEKSKDLKNAARFFKNVIKKNPDHVRSRQKLIPIYIELNKFREAKKECEIIYMLDRSIYNSIKYCKE